MRVFAALLCLGMSLVGVWIATEYVAAAFQFSSQLGRPLCGVGVVHIYVPWAWVMWDERYGAYAPGIFRNAAGISLCAAVIGCIASACMVRQRANPSTAHGSSRWATSDEVEAASLLGNGGIVLCQTNDAEFRGGQCKRLGRLVRHDGPEHVFCFAPTRSGKGVGLVIPTLLTWPHSVLVYDIKKENWKITAGWRRQFSRVWRFEPTSIDSVRFNPLLEIRKGTHEVKDTQNVADILVDPTGEKDTKDHWQTTAHSLLCGAILHVLYAERDKTLTGVAAFLSDPARTQSQVFEHMRTTSHLASGPHPVVAQAAREMLNKSDNELAGVVSTAMACLGLYRDPVIARNTAESDFRIADLMNGDCPASLYMVVPPSDLSRTRPIIRLMLNQIGRRLTESLGVGGETTYKHRLLLLLDEFPSLGKLDFFESSLAFIAGYGLKAFLIAQSLNQLEKAYGPNNSILDNCHVRLTYAANDDKTARRVSDLLGQSTEKKMQRSYSGSGFFLTNRSESEQEYARPLLTPAEVTQLPQDDGILLVGGLLPYRARKVRYYMDPRFKGRDCLPPPDEAVAQTRELPPPRPHDWIPTVPPTETPPRAAESSPATDVEKIWDDFFSIQKEPDVDDKPTEPKGDLPL